MFGVYRPRSNRQLASFGGVGHRPAKNPLPPRGNCGRKFPHLSFTGQGSKRFARGHCFQLWELMQKWGSWVPLFWDNLGLFLKSAFWDMSDVASAEAIQTPCRSFASEATIVSLSSLQDICGWHPNYAAHSHAWVMTCSLVHRCFWTVQDLGGKIASIDHDWFAVVCRRIRLWIVILFGHPLLPGLPCNMFNFHSIWGMLWGYFPPQESGVQTSHSATVTVLPSFKPLGMEKHFITTIFGQIEWGGPVADENISLISAYKKNKVQLSIVPPKNILRKPSAMSPGTFCLMKKWLVKTGAPKSATLGLRSRSAVMDLKQHLTWAG